jgi:ketosteroid isomerase-like protein
VLYTKERGVTDTCKSHRAVVTLGVLVACAAFASVAHATSSARSSSAASAHAISWTASASDSADAARAVEQFHQALVRGDSAAVLKLLAPTATILESGDSESVAEYRAHHLPADIEFAQAVKEVRTPARVTVRGDVAWATATSTTQGTFRGHPVNSAGAELMVLTRSPDGWRIAAIHWSSRKRGA